MFHRFFTLSVRGSGGGIFRPLRCRDSYRDGSYCPADRMVSAATATHGLRTDYRDQKEPAPGFRDYAATRPAKVYAGQYPFSSSCIDQLITLCMSRPTIKIQPAFGGSDVNDVPYPRFIQFIRCELPLESVECYDTGFPFTRSWASVPDQSLYLCARYQPPDRVYPAMLPAFSQVEWDGAITIDVAGLRPELF